MDVNMVYFEEAVAFEDAWSCKMQDFVTNMFNPGLVSNKSMTAH